jgi:hypothetical protein
MVQKDEFSKLSLVAKCPVCGGDLDRGYMIFANNVYSDTKKQQWLGKGETLVPMELGVNNTPALRCGSCRVVIFDYGHD